MTLGNPPVPIREPNEVDRGVGGGQPTTVEGSGNPGREVEVPGHGQDGRRNPQDARCPIGVAFDFAAARLRD